MAWTITNDTPDILTIRFTNGWQTHDVSKVRMALFVDEPDITILWNDSELSDNELNRKLVIDYNDITFTGVGNPSSAAEAQTVLNNWKVGSFGGATPGLPAVLGVDNDTDGNDLIIGTGDFLVVDDATPSEIAGFSASSELISLPVATYPSLTELAYVKGVTSAIQAQLDAKVFTIDVKMLSTNLADGITYFIGNIPQTPITGSIARNQIDIPYNCTLVGAIILFSAFSAVGTNEDISIYVRVNNTTDHLVATIGAATADRLFENMGLSVALTPSDYIHVKIVCPTWATNPTQTVVGGILYFKMP